MEVRVEKRVAEMGSDDREPEIIVKESEEDEEDVLAYWTEERMRRARPLPMEVPSSDAPVDRPQAEPRDAEERGTEGLD